MIVSVLLCNEPKFSQLTLVFSSFYRPFWEITSFYTTHSEQIIPRHVTGIKMLRFFGVLNHHTVGLWSAQVSKSLLKYLAKQKCWREVSRYKSRHYRKMHFKFLKTRIKDTVYLQGYLAYKRCSASGLDCKLMRAPITFWTLDLKANVVFRLFNVFLRFRSQSVKKKRVCDLPYSPISVKTYITFLK